MATSTMTGRPVTDLSNHILVLPSGGRPDAKYGVENQIVVEGGEVFIFSGGRWHTLTKTAVEERAAKEPLYATKRGQ